MVTELVKQFEITKKNLEKAQGTLTTTEAELKEMKKVTLTNWYKVDEDVITVEQ